MATYQGPTHIGYQRSLDGLRGVAILLVLLGHGEIISNNFAFIAVNTFFVLSGFLITRLLIAEWDQSHDISLRYFYLRRALRLLPALGVMLIVFVIFAFCFDPRQRAIRELYEALRALFYYTNWAMGFQIGRTNSLMHTWSLSVEEQFYIVWPILLLYLLRKSSRKSMLCWVSLGIFLSVLVRIGIFIIRGSDLYGYPYRLLWGTDTRADSLLCGCFASILVSSGLLPKADRFHRLLKVGAAVAGFGLLMLGNVWFLTPWMVHLGWLLASIFAAILITYLTSSSRSFMHRLLENPPIVYLGKISYGLYVWHVPVIVALKQHQLPWQHLAFLVLVLPIVLTSYYFIEKPCLRLKDRFTQVK